MNLNRKVLTDPIFMLLFVNSLLVLLAYSYNSYTQSLSVPFTVGKQLLIAASLLLLLSKKFSLRIFKMSCLLLPFIFVLFTIPRASFLNSLYSLSTLFVPYFYVLVTLSYLIIQYDFKTVFSHILLLINTVYLYPVLIYFIFGSGFEQTNIYGLQEQGFFFSNHYGWAASIYLTTATGILNLLNLKKFHYYIVLGAVPLAFYLLIISANRASFLAIGVALLALLTFPKGIFILQRKNLKLLPFLILIPAYFLLSIKDQKNSSINFLIEKNERQFKSGEKKESRMLVAKYAFEYFNDSPLLWITGVGLFNHSYIMGVTNLGAYHNSYWEILFGGGIIVFFLFCLVMVFQPLYAYQKYIGNFGLVIFPLMIIPFLESNLTGGQFLFFPWFTVMLLLNVRKIQ